MIRSFVAIELIHSYCVVPIFARCGADDALESFAERCVRSISNRIGTSI